ncbi:MAG: arylsulfatase [Pirellula sp.]
MLRILSAVLMGAIFGNVYAAEKQLPNVVLIMADDLGYGGLGCYGQTRVETPNIDRLAAGGMRFTNAYAGCCMCAPSRCVLMTGLHTGHCRVRANDPKQMLQDADTTLASLLKKSGYAVAGFGKWGLGDAGSVGEPYRHGFVDWVGYLDQADAHFHYPDWIWSKRAKLPLAGNQHADSKRKTYAPDVIHQAAMDFIRDNQHKPFFCYLATTIPHAELLVPEDSFKQYSGKFPEKAYVGERYASNDAPRATYAAMVTRLDRDVGRLMSQLVELGIADNTLILFTSDNGPINAGGADPDFFNNAGGLRGWKFSLYEGGIRVPFIAYWPGKIPAGTLKDLPISHDDILPSLCELAGIKTPDGLDGVSIAPTWLDKPDQKSKPYLYWESPSKDGFMQAMRANHHKAIRPKANAPMEIYDLSVDWTESRDLAKTSPELATRFEAMMSSARTVE